MSRSKSIQVAPTGLELVIHLPQLPKYLRQKGHTASPSTTVVLYELREKNWLEGSNPGACEFTVSMCETRDLQ